MQPSKLSKIWQRWIQSLDEKNETYTEYRVNKDPVEILWVPGNPTLNRLASNNQVAGQSPSEHREQSRAQYISPKGSMIDGTYSNRPCLPRSINAQGACQTVGPQRIFYMPPIFIFYRLFTSPADLLHTVNNAVSKCACKPHRLHRYRMDTTRGVLLRCCKCSSFIRAKQIGKNGYKVVQFDSRHDSRKRSILLSKFLRDRKKRLHLKKEKRQAQMNRMDFDEDVDPTIPKMFYSNQSNSISSIQQMNQQSECESIRDLQKMMLNEPVPSREEVPIIVQVPLFVEAPKIVEIPQIQTPQQSHPTISNKIKKNKKKQDEIAAWSTAMEFLSKKK